MSESVAVPPVEAATRETPDNPNPPTIEAIQHWRDVALPVAAAAEPPAGTVLRATGAVFTWYFEHVAADCWYEMGSENRRDWAYVSQFPNLVALVPSSSQTPAEPDEVEISIDVLTPYDLASARAVVDLVDRSQDASVDLPAEPAGTPVVPEAAYEAAARAMLPWDEGMEAGVDLFAWHRCGSCPLKANEPCSCTGTPYPSAAVRAAIDAVWAAALSHVREETAAATEFGVRWPADEFDDQPEILDDWYSSREMAEEWMRERDAGELIRRPVGATEVVTDADV